MGGSFIDTKKKNSSVAELVYLIIFVAYHLGVFLLFKNYNMVFWISYGFMIAAFALHIICVYFIFKNVSIEAVFFGVPLMLLSVYFICVGLFCSLVFMMFRAMANVKLTILIQALLLCAFIIIAIISVMTRDTVQSVDTKTKENVNFIKGINADTGMMVQRCQKPDTTGVLKKLSETIKYSDPISNREVESHERMTMQYVMELRAVFDSGDVAKIKELCEKIELLFIEQNKKLMISK